MHDDTFFLVSWPSGKAVLLQIGFKVWKNILSGDI